jgi:hypothetical protein
MPIYKIADIITDIKPKFRYFESIAEDYLYTGNEPVQIKISIREDYIRKRAEKNTHLTLGNLESIFLADTFNKKILKYNAIFLQSFIKAKRIFFLPIREWASQRTQNCG